MLILERLQTLEVGDIIRIRHKKNTPKVGCIKSLDHWRKYWAIEFASGEVVYVSEMDYGHTHIDILKEAKTNGSPQT